MSFAAWLSVATICLLGAMTPGPSLAVVLRYSVGHSRQAGFACALAHGLGIGFYAVITMTGLGILFQTVPVFHNAVSILGALYLTWLAVKAWRGAKAGAKFDVDGTGKVTGSTLQAARDGFMIAFLNPKIALFFLALLVNLSRPNSNGPVSSCWPLPQLLLMRPGIALWRSDCRMGLYCHGCAIMLPGSNGSLPFCLS